MDNSASESLLVREKYEGVSRSSCCIHWTDVAGELLETQRRVRSGLDLSTLRSMMGLSAEIYTSIYNSRSSDTIHLCSHVDIVQ